MLTKHPREVEADFLRFFQVDDIATLGAWRAADLAAVMITQPESWTRRAILGEAAHWDHPLVPMVASLYDLTALGVWMQTEDGQKNRNRPEPYPRPSRCRDGVETQNTTALSVDELDAFLARPRREVSEPITE